jgi:hypothetical protein
MYYIRTVSVSFSNTAMSPLLGKIAKFRMCVLNTVLEHLDIFSKSNTINISLFASITLSNNSSLICDIRNQQQNVRFQLQNSTYVRSGAICNWRPLAF